MHISNEFMSIDCCIREYLNTLGQAKLMIIAYNKYIKNYKFQNEVRIDKKYKNKK